MFADWLPPALLALAFLYFPDGQLPSSSWRPAVGLISAVCITGVIASSLSTGPVSGVPDVSNPLGNPDLEPVVTSMLTLASIGLPASFLLCAASLVIRFRRAQTDERQQIKWFAFAVGMITTFLIVGSALETIAGSEGEVVLSDRAAIIVLPILLSGAPVGIGVAILRYRLYDIDRIISRTLAYGALTAVLVSGYLLAVLTLQSVLPLPEESPLIVAASTLAVVAAFGPLRIRIKRAVDHRFNRNRYDASITIESFSTRLRDEVDLESLTSDLVAVVESTMQPRHVSVWLAATEERS